MAIQDFGGEIRINLSTGQSLTLRGTLTERVSGAARTVLRNSDGSTSGQVALQTYQFGLSLEYVPTIDYDALALAKGFSLEVVKLTQGEIVNMSNCMMSGEASFDAMTGEVSGMMVETGVKPIRTPISA